MLAQTLSRRGIFRGITALSAILFAGRTTASPAAAPPLFLVETRIAGTWHHQADAAIPSLAVGDPLVLRREPGNPHDTLAIEVLSRDGVKLGYVPRYRNPPFARLMDAGHPVSARLAAIHPPRQHEKLRLALYLG